MTIGEWIPAFAGMTKKGAGVTKKEQGCGNRIASMFEISAKVGIQSLVKELNRQTGRDRKICYSK